MRKQDAVVLLWFCPVRGRMSEKKNQRTPTPTQNLFFVLSTFWVDFRESRKGEDK